MSPVPVIYLVKDFQRRKKKKKKGKKKKITKDAFEQRDLVHRIHFHANFFRIDIHKLRKECWERLEIKSRGSWKSSERKFLSFEKDFKVDRTLYQHSDTFGRKHWQLGGLELPAPRGDQPPQRKPMKASYRIFLLASQKFPDPSTISNNRVHRTPPVYVSVSVYRCARQPRVVYEVLVRVRVLHMRAGGSAGGWRRARGGRVVARASTTPCRCTGCGVRV